MHRFSRKPRFSRILRQWLALICCVSMIALAGCYRAEPDVMPTRPQETQPTSRPQETTAPTEADPFPKAVRQVAFSSFSASVAVLYEDGTVRSACETYLEESDPEGLAAFYDTVESWTEIEKIWNHTGRIIGLKTDGTVVIADPFGAAVDSAFLTDVVDIAYNEPDPYIYALHSDGTITILSDNGGERTEIVSRWTDVKKLIPYLYYGLLAIHNDGSVSSCVDFIDDSITAQIQNANDLLVISDWILAMGSDGSARIHRIPNEYWTPYEIPNEEESLQGIVDAHAMSDYCNWICGLNEAGDLLISGGEEWYNTVYAPEMGKNPIDLSRFTDLAQLAPTDGMLPYMEVAALRKDGTVVSLNDTLNPYFDDWTGIKKLDWIYNYETFELRLLGLQEDGDLLALDIRMDTGAISEKHQLNFWALEDFAVRPSQDSYFLGFCEDGRVVISGRDYDILDTNRLAWE